MKKMWRAIVPAALFVVGANGFAQGISNSGTSGSVPGNAGGIVVPPTTPDSASPTTIDRDGLSNDAIGTTDPTIGLDRPGIDTKTLGTEGIDTSRDATRGGTMSGSGECICNGATPSGIE